MTAVTGAATYIHCTPVEIEVLRALVLDGADNDTVARRIGRSVETAKTHLKRITRRVQMSTRTALAVALLRGEVVVIDRDGRVVEF